MGDELTAARLDELERLARARSSPEQFRMSWPSTVSSCFHAGADTMAFAAACDPATVLRLIAAARDAAKLRERVAELERERDVGEARGAAQERAAVVAWLRYPERGWDMLIERFERGEHVAGEREGE